MESEYYPPSRPSDDRAGDGRFGLTRVRLRREYVALGIVVALVLLLAPAVGFWITWLMLGAGIFLITWDLPMQGTYRGLLYFLALLPLFHWYNALNKRIFGEDVISGLVGRDQAPVHETAYALVFLGAVAAGMVFVIRHRPRVPAIRVGGGETARPPKPAPKWSNVPGRTFSDVGGAEDAKRRIAAIVRNRLEHERYAKHGIVQNGILLYGPRGTGKTLLAEATAGEFKINYWYVRPTALMQRWIGSTEEKIRSAFAEAYAHRPVLFFIDEIDSIGMQRQAVGPTSDPTGSGKLYNAVVTELMQCVDHYRAKPGFVIMAATNMYDGLDQSLVRDMRFDEKVRVDLPDEAGRAEILRIQLSKRQWEGFPLQPFAKRTPGWSAAKLANLVNRAAAVAVEASRPIRYVDLENALIDGGGTDRSVQRRVEWNDLVLPASVERDLRNLLRLMEPGMAEKLGVPVPTGLLLVGPPGTGKTSIAQLIATQTRLSYYAITPADVPTSDKLAQVFARAREHSPSIIFIDEIDGMLPRLDGGSFYMGQHHVQFVEQALMLISQLEPENQVFLVGTTNHIDNIDPRVLRGGRFTEKIEIGLPDDRGIAALLRRYLAQTALAPDVTIDSLASRLRGFSPADLQGVIHTAKRMAMIRMAPGDDSLPPLTWHDVEQASQRNRR